MQTDEAGAAARPPLAPRPDRMSRLALRSAGVPFRVKVALVWLRDLAVLGFLFWASSFDNVWIREHIGFIARGLVFTLGMAAGGIALAIVLALLGALGRLSRNPIAYGVSGFYTSFFRGTPLLVQLFLFYLALPRLGINLTARRFPDLPGWPCRHPHAARVPGGSPRPRSELRGVHDGDLPRRHPIGQSRAERGGRRPGDDLPAQDAARGPPQAFRVIIPPTGNEFIAMMKDTALVSVLGQSIESMELFRRAQLLGNADVRPMEALVTAAALYWALTAIFTYFQSRLERRVSKGYVRGATEPRKSARARHDRASVLAGGRPSALRGLDDPQVGVRRPSQRLDTEAGP